MFVCFVCWDWDRVSDIIGVIRIGVKTDSFHLCDCRAEKMGCASSQPAIQRLTPEAASALLPPAAPENAAPQPRSLASKPDQILPWLYLGDHGASVSYKVLVELGITHVLNVKGGFKIPPPPYNKQLTMKSVPLDDFGTSDIASVLAECAAFINAAQKNGGACLVHCSQGMNRSPTIESECLTC